MIEKIITIKFIEPYRLIEWHDKKNLNAQSFLRGYSFARWHKDKKTDLGRPYITGTLVRSTVLKAAEELLWLRDGKLLGGTNDETVCCCGEFKNSKAKVSREDGLNVKRLRRRQTLSWGNKDICDKEAKDPCPFCLLLGRCDKADSKTDDPLERDVNFFNFSMPNNNRLLFDIKDIADSRVINRVDQQSGKAEDFFSIWEVDHNLSMEFSGKISLSERASNSKALLSLIENSLVLVDKIAGGLCFLTTKDSGISFKEDNGSAHSASNTSSNLYKNSTEPETTYNDQINRWAKEISKAFKESDKLAHLRLFADTVRELRRKDQEILNSLPKGHIDNLGKESKHFIWDIKIEESKKLRIWIKDRYNDFKKYHPSWNAFCELFGNALYSEAKDLAPEQFSSSRPLGAAQSIKIAEETRILPGKSSQWPRYEWLIKGDLVAMTPFYFGLSTENEQTAHTDMLILTDKDGHSRIPRSALRGILRRDLQIALGTGCRAELGQKHPCMCPICSLLKKITIKDALSEYRKPPRTRPRIRVDHKKGTVSKGALFELEVGPRGVVFPFELRFRTAQKKLPDALENILFWWQEKDEKKGLAFLSGQAGTGKGRFGLTNLNYKQWDLKKDNDWADYFATYGGRKKIPELKVLELSATADAPWKLFKNAEVLVNSPFITKDPVMSLIDSSGTDAVCYKSVYLDENGEEKEEHLLKGESFRGILRTAVGRREKDKDGKTDLLTRDHEDCECILCRLFGNEHEAGKVRVEDLLIEGTRIEKLIDRIAIDRFTGGAKDKNKFDLRALVGTPKKPLSFKGNIWINTELTSDECDVLGRALQDIHHGLYPLGGLGNEGFGWASYNPWETNSSQMVRPEPFYLMKNIKPVLDENKTYWPKYFLPFGEIKVKRTNTPPSHAYIQDDLLTGKLICTLTTKTPLIIADSAVKSQEENGHKTYKFFNLNIGGSENMCIPGSEIKGMISSIFEALTNSCLRIFDEKKRLSWRMEANNLGEWKAGMVADNGRKIKKFGKTKSISVYDDPKAFLDKFDDDEIGGKKPVTLFVKKLKAAFNIPKNESDGWNEEEGYLFVTYPNKIESHNEANDDIKKFIREEGPLPEVPSDLKDVKINFNRDVDGQKEKIFCCWDRKEKETNYYIMAKHCESFFYKLNNNEDDKYDIPEATLDKYSQLWSDYNNNPQAVPAEIFKSRIIREKDKYKTLKNGDLVYFRFKGKKVSDIIPVRISRIVDDDVLGQKFLNNRDDLRPCVREILDNKTAIKIKDAGLKEIYQHHREGLCPACSIFGTTFYKGRVGFGFAYPEADEIPVRKITLPLQERPRPTWAVPNKAYYVPGRSIRVHHQKEWKKYWDNIVEETKGEKERTVYAVAPDQKFKFEIKFENLKNWELGLLIYSIQLESDFAHKLGMGKALGFGSVKINVENINLINRTITSSVIKEKALNKLKEIWLGKENIDASNADLRKQLSPLFELLYYKINNEITVKYPKLKKEKSSEPDGYVDLAKDSYLPEIRKEKLTTPWSPWA